VVIFNDSRKQFDKEKILAPCSKKFLVCGFLGKSRVPVNQL